MPHLPEPASGDPFPANLLSLCADAGRYRADNGSGNKAEDMTITSKPFVAAALLLLLTACGGGNSAEQQATRERQRENVEALQDRDQGSFLDLFRKRETDRTINVNKHIWAASLDVLSFLPLEAADPFSGVIVTGWGRAAPGSPVYRATVYVTEPALDARSLRVALFRQSGGRSVPVSDETAEQIEDAILTRARQMVRGEEVGG